MHLMYDSVDLSQVPAMPHAVACYRNGRYANEDEARKRFPHARILPISVGGMIPCDCYDIERGDYSPDQAADLFKIAAEHGIWRPCFYAQLSGVMAAVRQSLSRVIKAREDVRLWVAYYNGQADLPAQYDAHQLTDRALGRNLDESICRDDFFPAAKPAHAPAPADRELMAATVTFDPDERSWAIRPAPAETERDR